MSRSRSYLRRGFLGIAFVGLLGFGASQALATPAQAALRNYCTEEWEAYCDVECGFLEGHCRSTGPYVRCDMSAALRPAASAEYRLRRGEPGPLLCRSGPGQQMCTRLLCVDELHPPGTGFRQLHTSFSLPPPRLDKEPTRSRDRDLGSIFLVLTYPSAASIFRGPRQPCVALPGRCARPVPSRTKPPRAHV